MTLISRTSQAAQPGPANQLDVMLMPWNEPATVTDDGIHSYTETWQPGSLVADGTIPVYSSHTTNARGGIERGPLIGVARDITHTTAGLRATLQLGTDEGRRVHELAALGVPAAVSIEADTGDTQPTDGALVRTSGAPAVLTGVATILPPQSPAYAGALVTAIRAAPVMTLEEARRIVAEADGTPEEPETPDTDEDEEDEEDVDTEHTTAETTGRAAVAELVRTEVARYGGRTSSRPAAHPLARFESLQEAMKAGYSDPEIARSIGRSMVVARALADNITTDPNGGVVHLGWINQIYGIVDQGRPAINAIGTAALPPDGMTIQWPTFAGDLTTMVGVQATQKTTITSVKVSIGAASGALKTFAGGSDISLQLINRSSPSYLEAYMRIMAASYAAVTDKDACTGLSAQVTLARNNFVLYDPAAADASGSVLRTAIFTASTKVQAATGQPASVVLAGLTAFVGLGGKLTPLPIYNASGSANASTLNIDVDGLGVVYDPYLAATEILVTNGLAAQWREDGPQTLSATDVERLGQSYAIWGLALLTPTIPTGIVGLRVANPTVLEAQEAYDAGYLDEAPEKSAKK